MSPKRTKEIQLKGLGVSPGIGIGVAYARDSGTALVREYRVPARGIDKELDRFRDALRRSRRQMQRIQAKARSAAGEVDEELGLLMDAYLQMLGSSRLVRGVEGKISESRINAEAAVAAEVATISEGFAAVEDEYIAARAADIREVGNRLIQNLTHSWTQPLSRLPKGSVVVTTELTPADTARLSPKRVFGAAASVGGPQGHAAIMARALGIPAVLGIPHLMDNVRSGDTVVIDGEAGRVIVNPTPKTLANYERGRERRLQEQRQLSRLRRLPAETRNGTTVTLHANVELPLEMNVVKQVGAAGIGLLRTEFMFMNRDDVPSEEDQFKAFRTMVEGMNGRPVTIRTLDIGGEKISPALIGDMGDSVSSPLGLRGIRLSLTRADVLETQFRAILRAAVYGPVRILLPMVATVPEVRRARDILERAARRLRRDGFEIPKSLPPCGIMIEVPAAALAADALARVSDFFALGSNDLTMYTLATDRTDEKVAPFFDPLHPGVLRLIQMSVEAALKARIPISICGEMAGDPRFTALLLGLGFRELSMAAYSIPKVKRRIRALDMNAADQRARIIMDQIDSGRIAALLDDFNALA